MGSEHGVGTTNTARWAGTASLCAAVLAGVAACRGGAETARGDAGEMDGSLTLWTVPAEDGGLAVPDASAVATDVTAWLEVQPIGDAALPDAATLDAAAGDLATADTATALPAAATVALATAAGAVDGDAGSPDVPDAVGTADAVAAPDAFADGAGDLAADAPKDSAGAEVAAPADAAAPGVCFKGGPPAPDAFVADVPPPQPASCPAVAPPGGWFTAVPPPTLQVVPGTLGADGSFAAYPNLAWVPLVYGSQGSFHIWAGFQVSGLAKGAAGIALDVQIWLDDACTLVASGLASKVNAVLGSDGSYSNVYSGSLGVPTQFYVVAAKASLYCGSWVSLHVRVHDPAGGAWGESAVTLRLYDSKP